MTSFLGVPEDALRAMQETVANNPTGGWEECWTKGLTRWDLGGVTPAVSWLLSQQQGQGQLLLESGTVLVPGCGSGYDVAAIATEKRHVTGMDISETALGRAKELAAASPHSENISLVMADFFTHDPEKPYDAVFDYTFFCAINPSLRTQWASQMSKLLSPDGKLFTLMFPISKHEGGPPFAVSLQAYKDVLSPHGFSVTLLDADSHPTRKDKEQFAVWTRTASASLL